MISAVVALIGFATSAVPPVNQPVRISDPVIVEATAPDPYSELPAWGRRVRDALARGRLKSRRELTDRDRAQVLLLRDEAPELKAELAELERLSRKAKLRGTLSQGELAKLVATYSRVEAKLENIPDEYMPRCRREHLYGDRRQVASCGMDVGRYLDRGTTWAALGVRASPTLVEATPSNATAHSTPLLPVLDESEQLVDVSIGDFADGSTGVAYAGEVLFERASYRAWARVEQSMRPSGSVHVELPGGTAVSLTSADRLRVIGDLDVAGERKRLLLIPRAAGLRLALTCAETGRLDGGVVYLDEAQSGRRRFLPLSRERAIVSGDARMRPELDISRVDWTVPFERIEVVAQARAQGRIRIDHFDDVAPAAPIRSRIVVAVAGEMLRIGDVQVEWMDVDGDRVKYRIRRT